eukprot:TRINITY_DN1791_c0_g1_i1.p1 TRINITY_DN1791_c0_g1~~TRINITY_DN1791_c0_g1_i1.p1  ORF type:complete len:997 (+),score=255.90 TRINITY_DN1791_c0_g1_i1:64-3054(+)
MGSGASRAKSSTSKTSKSHNEEMATIIDNQTSEDGHVEPQAKQANVPTPVLPMDDDSDDEAMQVQTDLLGSAVETVEVIPFEEVEQAGIDNESEDETSHQSYNETEAVLKRYANHIFDKADMDKDRYLDQTEFLNLVFSRTLDLRIAEEEAAAMLGAYGNANAMVDKASFYEPMLHLISLYSQARAQEQESGWQWFGMYFDDDPNSLPAYYNTQTGQLTYEKPAEYTSKQSVETQSFEDLELDDGTVLTTYVEDGSDQRHYLDFETGDWMQFPAEWTDRIKRVVSVDGANLDPDEADDELQTLLQDSYVVHPVTQERLECVIEDGERLYFDPTVGQWVAMPVSLELLVPEIQAAIANIRTQVAGWSSSREIVLALRAHGYKSSLVIEERQYEEAAGLVDADGQELTATACNASGNTVEASERLQEAERRLATAQAEQQVLQEHLDKQTQLAQAKTEQLHQLKEELTYIKDHTTASQKALISDQAKQTAEAEALKLKLEQAETQLSEQTQELEQLRQGGDLQATLQEREEALASAREQVAELKVAYETCNSQLTVTEADLKQIQSDKTEVDLRMTKVGTSTEQLSISAKQLRVDFDLLAVQVRQSIAQEYRQALAESCAQIASSAQSAVETATRDLRAKYRFEFRQRKLLYNKLQELRGNIRVFCRIRFDDRVKCVLKFPDVKSMGGPTQIACPNPKDEAAPAKTFEFEKVYTPGSTQAQVFEDTDAIITSCVDGYNVCLIAYGQTGSGKTYTMMGTEDNPGVNRRAVKELIRICNERDHIDYTMAVSLLEIYNEKIMDLLAKDPNDSGCDIRLDPKTKRPFVAGLVKREVKTEAEVLQALADGDTNRHVASTKMNSHSSRSHLLLQIYIEGHDSVSEEITRGKLTLVDLAGSERVAKTDATGQRLVEAAAINKSLTSLGQVFASLRTGNGHVPYRNCKLTHILEDSLGGDAKTCVFVNASPAESNLSETMGTLQFGSAIRSIELGPMGKGKKKRKH